MKRIVINLFFVSLAFFLSNCGSEALRKTDKFSQVKKYAVLPFSCPDKDMSIRLSKSLKEWLITFDYNIIEQEQLDKILIESGLSSEQIVNNYAVALNRLKGIDGIIIGRVILDKKSEQNGAGMTGGAGGSKIFISGCDAFVIDLTSGDIQARGDYEAPSSSELYGSLKPDEIGKKLALKLSPH
jgi:hypothetical protein